jgi:Tol biopolymer transport system component
MQACGEDRRVLEGPYLGQELPGLEPEVFAPGVISFGTHEHHLVISPNNDEIFYVVADRYRKHHIILQVRRNGDRWQTPEVAPFSGTYSDFAPMFSPDGSWLLFCSNRPITADAEVSDFNIWQVDRKDGGWSEPTVLPSPVNDETNEYNPTITADGTIYFQDHDETGVDIYRTRPFSNGEYSKPEKLGEAVNSAATEIGPWVTPDETVLMFTSDRDGGVGRLDFYACRGDGEGGWQPAVNLGPAINTPYSEAIITVSPDGKHLFFTGFAGLETEDLRGQNYSSILNLLRSPRNGDGTLYWVSADLVDVLDP